MGVKMETIMNNDEWEVVEDYFNTTEKPKKTEVKMKTMLDEAIARGRSTSRGHPIIWDGKQWLYEDTRETLESDPFRPCKKCGSLEDSNDGHVDECLGLLPGVKNACCGHGSREEAYIMFENNVMITGFILREKGEIKCIKKNL